MLIDHSMIYFAPGTWEGLWRNRQQLMAVFAGQNRVLYVEQRPYLRSTLARWRRGELKLAELNPPRLRQVAPNLFVFRYPAWAGISGRAPIKQLTLGLRRFLLQRALRQLHMARPIAWFSHPDMVDLVQEIPPVSMRLYHVVDEYTGYAGLSPGSRRRLEEREKQLIAQADIVVVVSKKLLEARQPLKTQTYLVPNGVNYQAYAVALADPYRPADIASIKPPRLGYSGLINERLDLKLLAELAQANPNWSLVFLGEVRFSHHNEEWQSLLVRPNVHHLGPVEIGQVPHYLKLFQVGLMPYVQNRETENISPLKLYDYLAAGLPIVSTDIPAAHEFSHWVYIGHDPCSFVEAVSTALADVTAEQSQLRREMAAQHSWEARAGQLSDLILADLARKAG